jgi:hypothetical protein
MGALEIKNGLFSLLFVYFLVRSAATHLKINEKQEKNPSFLISSAPITTSLYLYEAKRWNI